MEYKGTSSLYSLWMDQGCDRMRAQVHARRLISQRLCLLVAKHKELAALKKLARITKTP